MIATNRLRSNKARFHTKRLMLVLSRRRRKMSEMTNATAKQTKAGLTNKPSRSISRKESL